MTDDERKAQFIKNNRIPVSLVNGDVVSEQRENAWNEQQKEIDRLRAQLSTAFTPDKWHPASEEPEWLTAEVLLKNTDEIHDVFDEYRIRDIFKGWDDAVQCMNVTHWAYIADLPQPEGL